MADLQPRLTATTDQLMRLHNEFNIANTTRPQFDIIFQTLSTDLSDDHAFHLPQCIYRTEIDIAAIDKRFQHLHQVATVFIFLPHDASLNHGVTFPVTAMLLIILFHRGKAGHQRTGIAEWTQTHIDAVNLTIHGLLMQGIDQMLT